MGFLFLALVILKSNKGQWQELVGFQSVAAWLSVLYVFSGCVPMWWQFCYFFIDVCLLLLSSHHFVHWLAALFYSCLLVPLHCMSSSLCADKLNRPSELVPYGALWCHFVRQWCCGIHTWFQILLPRLLYFIDPALYVPSKGIMYACYVLHCHSILQQRANLHCRVKMYQMSKLKTSPGWNVLYSLYNRTATHQALLMYADTNNTDHLLIAHLSNSRIPFNLKIVRIHKDLDSLQTQYQTQTHTHTHITDQLLFVTILVAADLIHHFVSSVNIQCIPSHMWL